jgi:hypothetical protein
MSIVHAHFRQRNGLSLPRRGHQWRFAFFHQLRKEYQMQMKFCLTVTLVAGSLTSVALAQQPHAKVRSPKPVGGTHDARPSFVVAGRPVHAEPIEIRPVSLVNNQIVPLGPWTPYSGHVSDTGTPTLCFDAYHDAGGALPNTAPESGRWLLSWTAGADDFTEAGFAVPMNGILPAAIPIGAKYFDYLAYDKTGGDQYTAVFTSESYFDTAPPDATWGVFPTGWQWHVGPVGPGTFYYITIALTDPNVWTLPADGNGGMIIHTTRDAAGAVPATGYQLGLWGTQEHTTPPPSPAKVGTSGPNQWADESTGTICATSVTTNLPDGQFTLACENYAWTYNVNPNPLGPCFDFGFDAPAGCYANCDQSTNPPILNANDFQCFLNKYAANDTYANCDGSTNPPILNANDFQCFLNAYAAGCS